MSKIKKLVNTFYDFILKKIGKRKPQKQPERNIFGSGGELEMIEYGRMITIIRHHYRIQARDVGHIDFEELMFNLSKMTYVEVKALFAAIVEIQCQTNRTHHLDEKHKQYDQHSI